MRTINLLKRIALVIAAVLLTCTANAQEKGEMGVGVNVLYGLHSDYKNMGIGAKFQYNVIDKLRIEPSFNYFFKKDYVSMWDINANVHYLIPLGDNFCFYPLAGLTLLGVSVDTGFGDASDSKFGGNVGAGLDCLLTPNWIVNFEVKYQIVSDFDRPVISLGLGYKF